MTDANQCVTTFEVTLDEPDEIIVDVEKSNLSCYDANDGTIDLSVTGGVAPYTYSWSDLGNGAQRSNLSAGVYKVIITDSNQCCLLYTSPSPRDVEESRMPSSA